MDFEALLGMMEETTGFEGVSESVVIVGRWVAQHLVEEEDAIFRGD